jgi:hypothetical protein
MQGKPMTRFKFKIKDVVLKPRGYQFPGVIVARFRTTKGDPRYVVEATGHGYAGMLHIFNPDQLEVYKE